MEAIKSLAAEKKYLKAQKLIEEDLKCGLSSLSSDDQELIKVINTRADAAKVIIESWRHRTSNQMTKGEETAESQNNGIENDWEKGPERFNTKTFFKYEEGSGLISVLLEGQQDELPVFEQMSVINEVSLFKTFIPFCVDSQKCLTISHGEMVAYFRLSMTVISRDAAIHAYGVDCLEEYGLIVLLGESVDSYDGIEIPFKPAGWGHQIMQVKEFNAVIEVLSPNAARTCIITTVDPKVLLPRSLVNFAIKNLAALVLWLIQKQAVKVSNYATEKEKEKEMKLREEEETNKLERDTIKETKTKKTKLEDAAHYDLIMNDTDFYIPWLLPKLEQLCASRKWQLPTEGVMASLLLKKHGRIPSADSTPLISTATAASDEHPNEGVQQKADDCM